MAKESKSFRYKLCFETWEDKIFPVIVIYGCEFLRKIRFHADICKVHNSFICQSKENLQPCNEFDLCDLKY